MGRHSAPRRGWKTPLTASLLASAFTVVGAGALTDATLAPAPNPGPPLPTPQKLTQDDTGSSLPVALPTPSPSPLDAAFDAQEAAQRVLDRPPVQEWVPGTLPPTVTRAGIAQTTTKKTPVTVSSSSTTAEKTKTEPSSPPLPTIQKKKKRPAPPRIISDSGRSSSSSPTKTKTLKGTKSHVSSAGRLIASEFNVAESDILGYGSRGNKSDHPRGLALDFMINESKGDQIAAYALRNKAKLRISYVIWQQRYNDGSGWERMEDRGGATANHMDHVHISFQS